MAEDDDTVLQPSFLKRQECWGHSQEALVAAPKLPSELRLWPPTLQLVCGVLGLATEASL